MEDMSVGVIASIALVAIIALAVIYKLIRERRTGAGRASAQTAPAPMPASGPDAAAAVLSAIATHSRSEIAFQEYLADHTPEQLDDVPVYVLAHFMTASLSSPSRSKWLNCVVGAVVPRAVDPELIHTAEFFWDVNDKWLSSDTAFSDFCAEYLEAKKDGWSPAVRARIVLVGLLTLMTRDKSADSNSERTKQIISEYLERLQALCDDYFGADGEQVHARLLGDANVLVPGVAAAMASA